MVEDFISRSWPKTWDQGQGQCIFLFLRHLEDEDKSSRTRHWLTISQVSRRLDLIDLVPPVSCGTLIDDSSPVGVIAGSSHLVAPVYAHHLQIFHQCVLPCLICSFDFLLAIFWSSILVSLAEVSGLSETWILTRWRSKNEAILLYSLRNAASIYTIFWQKSNSLFLARKR